jgi:hypothetical protein
MQTQHNHESSTNGNRVQRMHLSLENTKGYMEDEQSRRRIDEHVQRFPNGRAQICEPEIVAGRGHQKQNKQREETKWLKRDTCNGPCDGAAFENAQDGIGVAPRMIGNNDERSVNHCQQTHSDPGVAAIVEQRQKPFVQPAKRANAKDDVQQNESSRSEGANQQNLISNQRE